MSHSYYQILFFIFAYMLFGGNTLPITSIYITEIMTEDERIKYVFIDYIFWPLGQLAALIFAFLKYQTLENTDWRNLYFWTGI